MAVICNKCGLPDDLCACGELDKEEARIVVRLETRRFSKTSTIIEGITTQNKAIYPKKSGNLSAHLPVAEQ